jgi:hypothetical protein
MEQWSKGVMGKIKFDNFLIMANTPILHYSNTPLIAKIMQL